jgi:hypothetical protein
MAKKRAAQKLALRDTRRGAPRLSRRQRFVSAAKTTLAALGLTTVFGGAVAAGVVLHINLPVARRLTAEVLSGGLRDQFRGSLEVGGIERLDLDGFVLSEATVKDEQGNVVLVVSGLRVRADVLSLLREATIGEDKATFIITSVRAERAEAFLIEDPVTGVPSIVQALSLRPSTAPSTPSSGAPRPWRVWFPRIEISRVYGRGSLGGLPTLEVQLSNVRGSLLGTPKGIAADVTRYGMVVRGLGGTDATGTGEVHIRAPGAVWSSFDGYFGNVPVNASVYSKGKEMKLTLDVARAKPEDVRALWADYPLQQPVVASIEASGDLPTLNTRAKFEVEGARITANGPIRLDSRASAELDVEARGVDIRALWPKAPQTGFDADVALKVVDKGTRIVVDVNGTTAATTIGGQTVPAVDVAGTFNEKGFEGKATLHEKGIPVKLALTVHPDGAIDVDAHARSFSLEKSPRIEQYTKAKGVADMRVVARIEKNRLDATLVADVDRFELGDVKLGKGHVTGHATGPIDAPGKLSIDAKLNGKRLNAQGVAFADVTATARGPAVRPRVTAKLSGEGGPEVSATATLETQGRPGVRDVSVDVKREEATLSGKIARLDFDSKKVELRDLKLVGAGGELAGTARISPDNIEFKAKGEGLDLEVVARALGLPKGMFSGKLTINADVTASKKESHGYVRIGLGNGSIANIAGVSLAMNATLEDHKVVGEAQAQVKGIGNVGATWNGELAGNAADAQSWRDIIGRAEIALSELELSKLLPYIPKSARIEKIAGTAAAKIQIERNAQKELPNVRVESAQTKGLEIVRTSAEKNGAPLVIREIEVQMNGGVSGERGDASGTTHLVYRGQMLASASGTVRVDWHALIADPENWQDQVMEAPVIAVITVGQRPFSTLPDPIRPENISGSIGGRVTLNGTPTEPRLTAAVDAVGVTVPGARYAQAVDVRASGEYVVADGHYGVAVDVGRNGRRFARVTAQGNANIVDGSWTGTAGLALEDAPLGMIPQLAESRVRGRLRGNIVLRRDKADAPPQIAGNVKLARGTVDSVPIGRGEVSVRSDGKQVRADLSFQNGKGSLTGTFASGIIWDGIGPEIDRSRPIRASLESRDYDAVVLSPFLRDIFSRLGGRVDGKLTATLVAKHDEAGKPTGEWDTEITGTARVREGVVQISPLGLEFRDVKMTASARQAGRFTVIEIRDVEGKARSEVANMKGTAFIYLQGVRVVRGNGSISVKEVPLLFQGVPQASASGFATFTLDRQENLMQVNIEIPQLTARLPAASGRSVVDLGDNPAITIKQPLREIVARSSGDILPWKLVFKLKHGVRLKRSDLDIPIAGQPVIDLGQETAVTGYVELEQGGRIQSWGKTFVIEAGQVYFDTGDAGDPRLAALASWRGPDGTVVYADVRGTLKNANVTLTSNPARSEAEIMALLFGGGSSSDETSAARTRESAGAGAAATAFNTLFADSLGGNVELRTATDENKASYTAAVRISESVWFEGTYRNRLEATQDTAGTEPTDVSGTIDWRFRRNWSLRTEVGTLGTGLDLLWQYRY